MAIHSKRWLAIACAALMLASCSSAPKPDLAPSEPVVQQPTLAPLPTGPLTAPQIMGALKERTFRYSGAGRNGTVTYYGDGTFSYEEAGKGPGTGIWQASNGKLCEARNPTSFLPKGTPSTCQPISSTGGSFIVGQMQLLPQ
jgi:hypothetical protein